MNASPTDVSAPSPAGVKLRLSIIDVPRVSDLGARGCRSSSAICPILVSDVWIKSAWILRCLSGWRRFGGHVFSAISLPRSCELRGGTISIGQSFNRWAWRSCRSGWVTTFWPFFLLMLVHCLLYVPTISITNSIAFANLARPAKGLWPRPIVGHHWLDCRELAIRVHPRRLGQGAGRLSTVGFVEWISTAALGTSQEPGAVELRNTRSPGRSWRRASPRWCSPHSA